MLLCQVWGQTGDAWTAIGENVIITECCYAPSCRLHRHAEEMNIPFDNMLPHPEFSQQSLNAVVISTNRHVMMTANQSVALVVADETHVWERREKGRRILKEREEKEEEEEETCLSLLWSLFLFLAMFAGGDKRKTMSGCRIYLSLQWSQGSTACQLS